MENLLEKLDEHLEEAMKRLVDIMRCMLTNIQEERQALMLGKAEAIGPILGTRASILEELASRQQKTRSLLVQFNGVSEETEWEDLADIVGSDKVSILLLRDHILTLADQIERQHSRNGSFFVERSLEKPRQKKQALTLLDPPLGG